ncbi:MULTISPECIES: hypothetical protein [Thermocrispum]|uniref:Flagellar basal body-associated protein FliL n=1 Tax=Thermocrispum agreste TaxID=37925 RepID=A0A2W4JM44_9PSEU|nr:MULTISPECIES: hypothetical protein [Thermocrispum]PZN00195.1 MAG: hypothetical protein DIU77_04160 [Thermocrispum agreste]
MSWQEELRKLDEDFSAGKITADEYRVRRDQVLSSAVAPQGDDAGGANAEATQIVGPAQQPQQPGDADSTQLVSPPGQPDASDATQVVQPPPADPTPKYSPDATQAVSWNAQPPGAPYPPSPPYGTPQPQSGGFPQQPPSPPGGFPQQPGYPPQQAAWGQQQQQAEPPVWGGEEFPPIAPPTEPDWVAQGPEFDDDSDEKGRVGKIIGAVVAVVVLAGIGIGAWLLWGKDSTQPAADDKQTTQQQQQPGPSGEVSPPPTSPTEEPDPLPIAELPGRAEKHPEVSTFEDMPERNYFNKKELAAYRKAGAGDTKFHVQHLGEAGDVTIVLAATDSAQQGEAAVKELRKIQIDNNAKPMKNAPANVEVTEITTDRGSEIRGHYLSGNVIVRIELRSEKALSEARTEFLTVLNAQLEELPADGS